MPEQNIKIEPAKTAGSDTQQSLTPAWLLKFRRAFIVAAHILAFAASLMFSFLVTNNMQFRRTWLVEQYPLLLFFFLVIKLLVFGLFKQYRGWWRYVGISDLLTIMRASLVSTIIIVALWAVFPMGSVMAIRLKLRPLTEVPQGVFPADMFITILILAGLRMAIRLYHEEFRAVEIGRLKRFLIVGAGNAGEALLREIHRMPVSQYEVVGFVDDDPAKHGTFIHDLPVLGNVEELPKICQERSIEEIAIAMPSATHRELRRVIQVCEGTKIRFRTVPSVTDIASGRYRVSQIRDVDINDLLGREVVELDLDLIENFLKDKVILVTGAGGSIGSEMSRQVCNFNPKLLLLVEQAENPLFDIENELHTKFPNVPLRSIICDITDKNRVEEIFEKFRPQVVIHAAAHKHVPLMELNPGEAIKNNVVGTQVVSGAADRCGSTNFVMISTDKAVNPTSIMGSSKRIAELHIQDLSRTSSTHFVTVRFGNVLGSNGSVIPIFKRQIAQGGPVTVTHPEMKRYFMTIPEASQLVLQAAAMGKGGEIFVLDMGEPVKIVDLARELITLSGFKAGEDIEMVFTGIRPGEKLFEELSIKGEDMVPTRHPKIGIWKNIPMDRNLLRTKIDELVTIAQTKNYEAIVNKIKELVPEYKGAQNKVA
jgi:FlaA1/EpsC-like NDP-sugar epimerase